MSIGTIASADSEDGAVTAVQGENMRIPGLVDLTEVGRGGFGIVFRAEEADLGRVVAVKVITGVLDPHAQTRFARERRAMGVLSGHPNIVTVYRTGTAPSGQPYLVMEYLPAGALSDRLRRDGAISWTEAIRAGIEVAGALESAHRARVLHRDIKPGNILIDPLGRAKLGDFGIARLDGLPETRTAVITASLAHAPPEVVLGHKPDVRSDLYSLGSTLYQLVRGAPAFLRGEDETIVPVFTRIVNDPAPDLRAQGVPDEVARVIERAMAKDPADRFASAADLGRALVEVQQRHRLRETPMWVREADDVDRAAADVDHAARDPLPVTAVLPPPPPTSVLPPPPRTEVLPRPTAQPPGPEPLLPAVPSARGGRRSSGALKVLVLSVAVIIGVILLMAWVT